jgi:hypothetical protein
LLGIHLELQDVFLRRHDQETRYVWDSYQNVPILAWEFYSYAAQPDGGAPFQKWEKEPVKFFENLKKKLRKC